MDQSTVLFHVLHGGLGAIIGTCVLVAAAGLTEATFATRRAMVVTQVLCTAVFVGVARTASHYQAGFWMAVVAACCVLCGVLWEALGDR